MRRFAITLTAVMCLFVVRADSQEKTPAESEVEVMKKWKAFSSPGEKHAILERMVGNWTTITRVWPGGPSSAVSESKGTSKFKWILGKRHVQHESHSVMLGMQVDAVGFFGYDNFKKKFTSTWMESTSTARYSAEGAIDRAGKVITMHGKMDEFLTGEHDKVVRYELNLSEQDTFSFKIFDLGLGKDSLVVETVYSRVEERDEK